MVRGISRQVIMVHNPDPKLFEQAIFILRDGAVKQGMTDESLLREANQLIQDERRKKKIPLYRYGPVWACGGAAITGMVWLLTVLL